jgi:hypothetical protein
VRDARQLVALGQDRGDSRETPRGRPTVNATPSSGGADNDVRRVRGDCHLGEMMGH